MLYDITDNYYTRLPEIRIWLHMQAGIQQICADYFCRVRYKPNSIGSSRVVNYFGESFFTITTFRRVTQSQNHIFVDRLLMNKCWLWVPLDSS